MSKSRLPMYLGLGAAGAGGWYLYRAGGDPKKATQKFEGESSISLFFDHDKYWKRLADAWM